MKGMKKIFATASSFLFLLANSAFADQGGPTGQTIELPNPLGSTSTVEGLIKTISDWLAFKIGPVVAALMIIIGALFILFAGGDEERFKTGKKIIMYTAIGYGIIFIGAGIADIIEKLLGS